MRLEMYKDLLKNYIHLLHSAFFAIHAVAKVSEK